MPAYNLGAPDALGAQHYFMEIVMKRVPLLGAALALFALPLLATLPASAVGEGDVCGGFVGAKCDEGLFCEYPAGDCSASAGVCEKTPDVCIEVEEPVCACGDPPEQFGNDCKRKRAGARKDHDGPCKKAAE
jgi:hypothetical protein